VGSEGVEAVDSEAAVEEGSAVASQAGPSAAEMVAAAMVAGSAMVAVVDKATAVVGMVQEVKTAVAMGVAGTGWVVARPGRASLSSIR